MMKGYGPLYDWVKAHTWRMHAPPGGHDVMVTNGSNQTIEVCALQGLLGFWYTLIP